MKKENPKCNYKEPCEYKRGGNKISCVFKDKCSMQEKTSIVPFNNFVMPI